MPDNSLLCLTIDEYLNNNPDYWTQSESTLNQLQLWQNLSQSKNILQAFRDYPEYACVVNLCAISTIPPKLWSHFLETFVEIAKTGETLPGNIHKKDYVRFLANIILHLHNTNTFNEETLAIIARFVAPNPHRLEVLYNAFDIIVRSKSSISMEQQPIYYQIAIACLVENNDILLERSNRSLASKFFLALSTYWNAFDKNNLHLSQEQWLSFAQFFLMYDKQSYIIPRPITYKDKPAPQEDWDYIDPEMVINFALIHKENINSCCGIPLFFAAAKSYAWLIKKFGNAYNDNFKQKLQVLKTIYADLLKLNLQSVYLNPLIFSLALTHSKILSDINSIEEWKKTLAQISLLTQQGFEINLLLIDNVMQIPVFKSFDNLLSKSPEAKVNRLNVQSFLDTYTSNKTSLETCILFQHLRQFKLSSQERNQLLEKYGHPFIIPILQELNAQSSMQTIDIQLPQLLQQLTEKTKLTTWINDFKIVFNNNHTPQPPYRFLTEDRLKETLAVNKKLNETMNAFLDSFPLSSDELLQSFVLLDEQLRSILYMYADSYHLDVWYSKFLSIFSDDTLKFIRSHRQTFLSDPMVPSPLANLYDAFSAARLDIKYKTETERYAVASQYEVLCRFKYYSISCPAEDFFMRQILAILEPQLMGDRVENIRCKKATLTFYNQLSEHNKKVLMRLLPEHRIRIENSGFPDNTMKLFFDSKQTHMQCCVIS